MNIFDKLNTPKAVIAILVVIVAVNGFILFQQRGNDEPSSTETAQEAPTNNENNENNESDTSVSRDTSDSADTENDAESRDTSDSGDSEAANEESGDEPGGDEPEQEEQSEQRAEESESSNQSEGNQTPEQDEPEQEDSQPSDENSSNEGSSDEEQDEPELLLAGLGGAFGDCDTDPEDCVRSYMSSNISDSRFLGGRVDLAAAPQATNSEVLYFESSELGVCEFEREIYESPEGQNYTVILLGEGSVQSEEGNECIPTA